MKRLMALIVAFAATCSLSACQTSDSALREQGNTESYIQGFHDGRHSGMSEGGNRWEHYIRDTERFDEDSQYRDGWLAGEAEGMKLQAQAKAVGEAVGNGYSGYRIGQEAQKAGPHPKAAVEEAMKGVDTGTLKALEK